jgi:erythrocyte band 7 integral membrane protein
MAENQEHDRTEYSDAATDEYGFTNASALKPPVQQKPAMADVPIIVQPIRKADLQPSYAHEMGVPDNGWYGSFINSLGNCFGGLGAIPCCFCCPNPFKSVNQGEVGLITRFGQFYKAVDPGLVKVNVISEKLHTVEVRIQVLDVPHQVCLTKDNVNIKLSSVLYYHIISPHKAKFGVTDVITALMERTQTTLRHVVGARVLQEIVERREEVAASIQEIIDETASSWGVKVESILIKDIILSQELQDSLSQAAKSKRAGESKIITARAEVESAKLMRRAADILASKAAMQIRYLEAMQTMARSANSKVIFMPSQSAIENLTQDINSTGFQGSAEASGTNRMAENTAYQEVVNDI